MKHLDGIDELGDVDNSKGTGSIPNPKLLDTLAHGIHGLPVIWFLATLYVVKLMACLSPGLDREGTKVIKGVAPELNGLGIGHAPNIQVFVFIGKLTLGSMEQAIDSPATGWPCRSRTPASPSSACNQNGTAGAAPRRGIARDGLGLNRPPDDTLARPATTACAPRPQPRPHRLVAPRAAAHARVRGGRRAAQCAAAQRVWAR